jgi:hypothetical protein
LASALLEKEVLAGEEVDEVLGINVPRPAGPPRDLTAEGRLF